MCHCGWGQHLIKKTKQKHILSAWLHQLSRITSHSLRSESGFSYPNSLKSGSYSLYSSLRASTGTVLNQSDSQLLAVRFLLEVGNSTTLSTRSSRSKCSASSSAVSKCPTKSYWIWHGWQSRYTCRQCSLKGMSFSVWGSRRYWMKWEKEGWIPKEKASSTEAGGVGWLP